MTWQQDPSRTGLSLRFLGLLIAVIGVPRTGRAQSVAIDPRCGAYCLFVAEGLLDRAPSSLAALEGELGPVGPDGYSIQQLRDQATRGGIATLVVQTDLDGITSLKRPFSCIALLKRGHFVVVRDVGAAQVALIDPPRTSDLPRATFQQEWTGYALILSTTAIERVQPRRGWLLGVATVAALGVLVALLARRRAGRHRLVGLLACAALTLGCTRRDESRSASLGLVAPAGNLRVALDRDDLGTILLTDANRRQEVHGTIRNDSASEALIRRIRPGCACTDVKLDTSFIRAGQAVRFHLAIHPGTEDADRRNVVVFETDRPEQPELSTAIRWKTVNPLSAAPAEIAIRRIGSVPPPPTLVTIHARGFRPCRACEITWECPSLLKVAWRGRQVPGPDATDEHVGGFWEDGQAGDLGILSVDLEEKTEPCDTSAEVDVKVSCRGVLRASSGIAVRVQVDPQVKVTPNRLSLGLASAGTRHSVAVVFRRPDGRPFTVRSVACPELTGHFTAHHETNIGRAVQTVTLDVEVPTITGVWRTNMDVTLSTGETLGIPLSAVVR